ncbi:MAG TPA: fibro-slime domain-containing protein, partial [Polyangiaceae bacterium]
DEPGGHPDFQGYGWIRGITPGIVMPDLGADQKPVYNGTGPIVGSMNRQQTTGPEAFNQWYRNTPCAGQNVVTCPPGQDSVNLYTEFVIPIQAVPGQLATYDNAAFFPIDNQLFGNYSTYNHNFHFTTELHTTFLYSGGEIFRFTGDDDLWVFINGKLAIDLGGIHSSASQQVDLDARAVEFGITIGTEYPLDLFHAERHTTESHFRIDTSIGFTNCAPIIILY